MQLLLRPIKDRTSGVSHTDEIFRVKAEGWEAERQETQTQLREGRVLKLMLSGDWKVALCGVRQGQACWEP